MNNSKLIEKKKLKNGDEITFGDSFKKIVYKNKERKRERSRSNTPPKKESKNKTKTNIEKELPVTEDNNEIDLNHHHIKSEIIWNSVKFDNDSKKEKFLRLMGAKKNPGNKKIDDKKSEELSEKLANTFKHIENDLTNQFYSTMQRKYN